MVEEYKYLGSVVNEYLTNVILVEERGRAGTKALSDWLRTHVKAGGGMAKMQQIVSSTSSQQPSPLPHLYKLCPLQSPPFHCHLNYSICPPCQSPIFPTTIFLPPNNHISSQNGQCLLSPHFHIPYTSYVSSSYFMPPSHLIC